MSHAERLGPITFEEDCAVAAWTTLTSASRTGPCL